MLAVAVDRRKTLSDNLSLLWNSPDRNTRTDSLTYQTWLSKHTNAKIELDGVAHAIQHLEKYLKEHIVEGYQTPASTEEATQRMATLLERRRQMEARLGATGRFTNNNFAGPGFKTLADERDTLKREIGKNTAEYNMLKQFIKDENIRKTSRKQDAEFTEAKGIIRQAEGDLDAATVALNEGRSDEALAKLYSLLDVVQTFRERTQI